MYFSPHYKLLVHTISPYFCFLMYTQEGNIGIVNFQLLFFHEYTNFGMF